MNYPRWILVMVGIFLASASESADVAPKKGPKPLTAKASEQVFKQSVMPVLANRCVNCHNAKKMKGDIDLSSSEKVMAGGKSGALVMPGNARESLLMQALLPDAKEHMPPKGQLTPQEIAAIGIWITRLKDPTEAAAESEDKSAKPKTPPVAVKPEEEKPKTETSPEQLASIKLNLAKRFEKDGLSASAKTRYLEIIKMYPESKAAAEATTLLAKLKK